MYPTLKPADALHPSMLTGRAFNTNLKGGRLPGPQLCASLVPRRQGADLPFFSYINQVYLEGQLTSVLLGDTEKGGGHF